MDDDDDDDDEDQDQWLLSTIMFIIMLNDH